MSKYAEKKDYLVGKMIDGAITLDEFFYTIFKGNPKNLTKLRNNLVQKYELTKNQKKYLQKVISNVYTAREIIKYVKKEYGFNKDGNIDDKINEKRLMRDMHSQKPPNDYFNVSIGKPFFVRFELPDEYFYFNKSIGFAPKPIYFLNNCLKKLKSGKKKYLKYAGLCYSMKLEVLEAKLTINNFFKIISTEDHEQKHIIDHTIIGNMDNFLSELSAELYCGFLDRKTLKRDVKAYAKEIIRPFEYYKEAKKDGADDFALNIWKDIIKERKRTMRMINDFPLEVIKSIKNNGLTYREISFLIPTTNFNKLGDRLKMIDKYVKKHTKYLSRGEKDTPEKFEAALKDKR